MWGDFSVKLRTLTMASAVFLLCLECLRSGTSGFHRPQLVRGIELLEVLGGYLTVD